MPVGASVGLGVAGLAMGRSDSKKARALMEQQLQLQREQLAFAKQRYDENQAMYGGLKQQLVDAANDGVKADLQGVTDRASADVAQSFDKAQGEAARGLSRYGINPNSGRAIALRTGLGIGKAATEANSINKARRDEDRYAKDTTWNRRWQVTNLGVNELNGSANQVSAAYDGMSRTYGAGADRASSSAAANYGMAGQFAGLGLSIAYDKWKPTTKTGTGG